VGVGKVGRRTRQPAVDDRVPQWTLQHLVLAVPIPRHPDANALLAKARDEVAVSLAELRDLARGPHPAVLSALGLAVTL
jgi:hypothetical protein